MLPLLLSIAACVISVFSLFYLRSFLKQRTSHERILSELREEVNIILRSINETTDRDISLIEEREKNLKSLLAEIEKRMKVYIREMEAHQKAEDAALPPPNAASSGVPSGGQVPYQELGKQRYRIAANAAPAPEPPEKAAVEAAPADKPQYDNSASVDEQIRTLMQGGLSIPMIASRLGKSIAEVEFIAALLERRSD